MLNQITVMGRLTRDPELKTTQAGHAVASFSIACDRDFGEKKTDFFRCTAWRQTAEFISKYFHKGNMICIAGRLQNTEWTDKDGNKRTTAEILAEHGYFCEGKSSQAAPDVTFTEVADDGDLPF